MTAIAALAAASLAASAHADNAVTVGGYVGYLDTQSDFTSDDGVTMDMFETETDGPGFGLFANGRYEKGNGTNLQLGANYVNVSASGESTSGDDTFEFGGSSSDGLFTTAGLFAGGEGSRYGGGFTAARVDGIGSIGGFGEWHQDFSPNFIGRAGLGAVALDGELDGSIFQANVGGFYGIGASQAITGDLFYVDGNADFTEESGDDTDVTGFGVEFGYLYNPNATRVGKGFKLGYSDLEYDIASNTSAFTETNEAEQFYFKFQLDVSLTGEANPTWRRRDGYYQYGNRPLDEVLFLTGGFGGSSVSVPSTPAF